MSPDDVRIVTSRAYDSIVEEFVRRNTTINADLVEFRQHFMRAVGDRGCVIDVGSGPGRDAIHFRSHGLRAVGIDASANMARYAHGEGVPMLIGDMRAMPIARGSLGGVWSAASLLHVPRSDVEETLVAWRSLLRPSGILGLSTSIGEDEGWEACPYDPTAQHDPAGLRRWFVHHDQHQLLELVTGAGFQIITSRERVSNRRWLQVLARSSA